MADLISRTEMLKWLEVSEFEHLSGEKCFESMMREIKNAPAVNRWIPVDDALPESSEDVLVWFEYFRYGEYNCMYQTYNIGNYFAKHDSWMVGHETGWQKLRVIAWMPLPEPPKEDENE